MRVPTLRYAFLHTLKVLLLSVFIVEMLPSVGNGKTGAMCEIYLKLALKYQNDVIKIYSKLIIKTPELRQ